MYLMDEHSGLEVIPREDCVRLLAGERVGRLGVVQGGEPLIFPVNYVLDGEAVVFRTDPGTKLTAGSRAPVCFEVDRVDLEARTGWSVLMRGELDEVDDFAGLRKLLHRSGGEVRPWAPGAKSHWLRLIAYRITGRRIRPQAVAER